MKYILPLDITSVSVPPEDVSEEYVPLRTRLPVPNDALPTLPRPKETAYVKELFVPVSRLAYVTAPLNVLTDAVPPFTRYTAVDGCVIDPFVMVNVAPVSVRFIAVSV